MKEIDTLSDMRTKKNVGRDVVPLVNPKITFAKYALRKFNHALGTGSVRDANNAIWVLDRMMNDGEANLEEVMEALDIAIDRMDDGIVSDIYQKYYNTLRKVRNPPKYAIVDPKYRNYGSNPGGIFEPHDRTKHFKGPHDVEGAPGYRWWENPPTFRGDREMFAKSGDYIADIYYDRDVKVDDIIFDSRTKNLYRVGEVIYKDGKEHGLKLEWFDSQDRVLDRIWEQQLGEYNVMIVPFLKMFAQKAKSNPSYEDIVDDVVALLEYGMSMMGDDYGGGRRDPTTGLYHGAELAASAEEEFHEELDELLDELEGLRPHLAKALRGLDLTLVNGDLTYVRRVVDALSGVRGNPTYVARMYHLKDEYTDCGVLEPIKKYSFGLESQIYKCSKCGEKVRLTRPDILDGRVNPGRGWHGEPRRKSLASRGVETVKKPGKRIDVSKYIRYPSDKPGEAGYPQQSRRHAHAARGGQSVVPPTQAQIDRGDAEYRRLRFYRYVDDPKAGRGLERFRGVKGNPCIKPHRHIDDENLIPTRAPLDDFRLVKGKGSEIVDFYKIKYGRDNVYTYMDDIYVIDSVVERQDIKKKE